MGDHVRKLVPYYGFETDAIEGWLEQQAREGLILHTYSLWAKLKKTKPCRLRYRIETTKSGMNTSSEKKAQKSRERIKELSECGWQYVTALAGKSILYKTEDLSQTELPPNPDGAAPTRASSWAAGCLTMLTMCGTHIFQEGQRDLPYWLMGGLLDFLQVVILSIAILVLMRVETLTFRKLEKRKTEGNFPNRDYHTAERARRGKRAKVAIVGCLAFAMVFMLVDRGNSYSYYDISLTDYDEPIPFPLLVEINAEEGEKVALSERYHNSQVQMDSRCYLMKERAFFVPKRMRLDQAWRPNCLDSSSVQCRVDYMKEQAFFVPKRMRLGQAWRPNCSDLSSVQYRADYYELRAEKMAKWMMEEGKREEPAYTPRSFQSLPATEGVEAFYARLDANQYLLLSHEKKYIDVYYTGETDLRDCLPLYECYLKAEVRQGGMETPA